ncbi:MAG: 50S ribosomal protein L21 [Negativicutes bacterium]|nr:50S ribosomal protein L21 [Negativicutes bacterium]
MYAILSTGGKQYKAAVGDVLTVEKIDTPEGDMVKLDQVMTIVRDDQVIVGRPLVDSASVSARVIEHGKGKKIRILKYKAKSNYRRRMGHRQPYTRLQVESIDF